ncbi:hypothetical protein E1287_37475 [Actinomadura sp. KC06]|uniref:hypothetical protein n=1 Tax=Actinomadura sp. KC06 TaxID=2530369 RepID=UPI00104BB1C0|nr:hypothetical protein [Actinomadura sp. KC06]TDD25205.1 hypothetical protein E1287_37475 [Actinomadura sp. KC06]
MSTPVEMNQAPSIGAGRAPAAAAVRAWLTDVLRPRLCVVTGAPGTGKSHLTAWTALADTGPVRAVHAMISARGMTPHALAWALAEQLSVAGGSPDVVVAGIAADRRPATVVIGELDEAGPACDGSAAPAIITGLLDPLLESQHVRLLVEGRPEVLSAFTVPAEVVHLDNPELTDREAFTAWLRQQHPNTVHAEALFPNVGLAELALSAEASENVPERWLDRVPPEAVPALEVLASAYGLIDAGHWTALTAALTGDLDRARASVNLAAPLVTRVDDGFQIGLRPLREALVRRRTPELNAQIEHAIGGALYTQIPKDPAGRAPLWAQCPPYITTYLLRHAAVTGVADRLISDAGQLVHADPRAATAVLETLDAAPPWPVWRAVGPGLLSTSDPAERASLLRLSALLLGDDSLAAQFAPHASTAWEPAWSNTRPKTPLAPKPDHNKVPTAPSEPSPNGNTPTEPPNHTAGPTNTNNPTSTLAEPSPTHGGTSSTHAEASPAHASSPHAETSSAHGAGAWTGPVSALTRRDNTLLVAAADGTLHTLDAASGKPIGRIAGGVPEIWGLVWFPDGTVLHLDAHRAVRASAVTKSESRADRISGLLNQAPDVGPAQVGAGTVRDTLKKWHGLTALGTAGTTRLIAGDTSGQVHVWEPSAPQHVRSHRLHDGPVTAVAGMQGDSGRLSLISGGADGTVRLWAIDEPPVDEPLIRRNTGVTATTFARLPLGPVAAIAWTDGHIRIWDLLTGDERVMNLGLTVNALALTPEGLLAVAGPHGTATLRLHRISDRPGSSTAPQ